MLQPIWRGRFHKQGGKGGGIRVALKVALHDGITHGSQQGGPDQIQITVAKGMNTDPGDEIVFDGAIGHGHQCTTTKTGSHHGKEQSTPSFPGELGNTGFSRSEQIRIRALDPGQGLLSLVNLGQETGNRGIDLGIRQSGMEAWMCWVDGHMA